jgi:aspartyl-tRNA(Asn)/glutamyl-tRNA(Gln) amidotransferase subunit A
VPEARHFDDAPAGIFLARPTERAAGIPLAVKDLFDTAGLTTTYGSSIFARHVPTATAEAVRRLEAAGYANVGKTNLHEFAYGVTSMNPHFGWVPNPLATGRIAGGSSGGSAAALAAGLVDAALGTDTGGSIRIPAAYCGVVGFKPTFGLVSLDGCWPLAPSYDHAGPMARDVATCAAMMEVLADEFEATTVALADLRVAVAWTEDAAPGIRARLEEAAARFPHHERIEFPRAQGNLRVFMREVANVHADLFREHSEEYGPDVAWKLRELCFPLTDAEVGQAEQIRDSYRDQADELLERFDLLLTPTQGTVAPTYEEAADDALRTGITRFTNPFNALGRPALALPCGPAEHGLPASAQLIGRPGTDALVLAAGAALESLLQASERVAAPVDL